jgi:16S rRNA (guanine527-N7)-methyltransferase
MSNDPAWTFGPSLKDLATRYTLSPDQTAQLRVFGVLLVQDELAPTTVREPQKVRDDHFADSLTALELIEVRQAQRIADLGAGAGVPGLPLAVALPHSAVTLVEGNRRKCEFMERAAGDMELRNVQVIHGRAETWSAGIGSCDVVTARALAPLDVLAEYAAPLLKLGGVLVAWRGHREPDAEAEGARAAAILGLDVLEPLLVTPYPGAEHRHLHLMKKIAPTPDRFPRRDGVARKRPLGKPN